MLERIVVCAALLVGWVLSIWIVVRAMTRHNSRQIALIERLLAFHMASENMEAFRISQEQPEEPPADREYRPLKPL